MCPRGRPRGQGRSRGLHLWLTYCQVFTSYFRGQKYQFLQLSKLVFF